jgi:hypothetical protein
MLDRTADAVEREREKQVIAGYRTRLLLTIGLSFASILVGFFTLCSHREYSLTGDVMTDPISNNATYQGPVAW